MSIATLTIDLQARLANIERDMGRAANIAQRNADRMSRAFRGVSRTLAGLGVGLTAGFFATIITNTAKTADELSKLSQKTGVAVEDLSRLQYAAELSGVSNDQLATGIRTLSQRMADAAKGTGEAADAFRAMGVEIQNADGTLRSQDDVLKDVADRFASYKDGAEKSALAQRIFGRSGAELIPLLNQGSKGLKDMADESDRLGRTMSGEVARAAEEFNDNLTRLKSAVEGLVIQIAGPLIQALADLTSSFFRARMEGETFAGSMERMLRGGIVGNRDKIQGAEKDVARLTDRLKELQRQAEPYASRGMDLPDRLQFNIGRASAELADAKRNLSELQAKIEETAQVATEAAPIIQQVIEDKPPTRPGGGRVNEQQRIFEAIQRQIGALELQAVTFNKTEREATLYRLAIEGATQAQLNSADAVLRNLENLRNQADWQERARQIYDQTRTPIELLNRELGELNDLLARGALDWDTYARAVFDAQDRFDQMTEKVEEVAEKLDEFSLQAARNMQDAFAQFLFDPFNDGVRGMLRNFVTAIHRMASELLASKLLNLLGGSLAGRGGFLGNFGAALVSVSGARASGGPVRGGSAYLVGEKGPELFVPRQSGSIVPNNKMGTSQTSVRIVNAFEGQFVGDYMGSDAGEQVIMNVVRRNATTLRQLVSA